MSPAARPGGSSSPRATGWLSAARNWRHWAAASPKCARWSSISTPAAGTLVRSSSSSSPQAQPGLCHVVRVHARAVAFRAPRLHDRPPHAGTSAEGRARLPQLRAVPQVRTGRRHASAEERCADPAGTAGSRHLWRPRCGGTTGQYRADAPRNLHRAGHTASRLRTRGDPGLMRDVYEQVDGSVTAPGGFRAAGVACGIKASKGLDLAVVAPVPASAAAVFTTNLAQAAPVLVSARTLRVGGAAQRDCRQQRLRQRVHRVGRTAGRAGDGRASAKAPSLAALRLSSRRPVSSASS